MVFWPNRIVTRDYDDFLHERLLRSKNVFTSSCPSRFFRLRLTRENVLRPRFFESPTGGVVKRPATIGTGFHPRFRFANGFSTCTQLANNTTVGPELIFHFRGISRGVGGFNDVLCARSYSFPRRKHVKLNRRNRNIIY